MSIVWKFLVLYNLLEAININYQLKYEHATTRHLHRCNKINKRAQSEIYGDLKGKERVVVGSAIWLVGIRMQLKNNCTHKSLITLSFASFTRTIIP